MVMVVMASLSVSGQQTGLSNRVLDNNRPVCYCQRMPTNLTDRPSARERLLTAADELFYAEGVHTVGIDRVIERADVSKASLYKIFGSKDELIRSYLAARHATRRERLTSELTRFDTPRERLLGVFDVLGELFLEPGFHGCPFVNASAEARPDSPAVQASDAARAWRRSFLLELSADAGAADPPRLADQLMLLYDGAHVGAGMDRDPGAAATARAAAEVLLDAATGA
jgi:AcrR family transcriptional regulator